MESNDFVQSVNQCISKVLSTRPPTPRHVRISVLTCFLLTQGKGAQLPHSRQLLGTWSQELHWAKPINLFPHHTRQIQEDIAPLSSFVLFIPLAYSSRLTANGLSSVAYTDVKKNSRKATQPFSLIYQVNSEAQLWNLNTDILNEYFCFYIEY